MRLHGEALAADEMLARVMEMELDQLEVAAGGREHAGVGDVHLDGVAVVDDGVGALAPGHLERRKPCLEGVPDIDRRLLGADPADPVGGVELGPLVGSAVPLIGPMCVRRESRGYAMRTKRNRGQ
jgi:hypothetical protein